MHKQHMSAQELAMIGMFTALLSVLSILQIPMPSGVPITLQTFAVALCGYVLGHRKGILCVILYLLIGLVGLPVFSGMQAGIGTLLNFTGGFLYSFPLLAGLCGIGIRTHKKIPAITLGLLGLLSVHAIGAFHYTLISSRGYTQALLLVSLPYLLKDVLCVAGALFLSSSIRNPLTRAGIHL